MEDDVDVKEKDFQNFVREFIIALIVFFIFSFVSHFIICVYKKTYENYALPYEDIFVNNVSNVSCTIALTVSFGAVMLLPVSIVANEAILIFPNSYYLKWVNGSLIYKLWNTIFISSNLTLFVFLPFAYLFIESEGLPGSKRGIMPRIYETSIVFVLLCVAVCGLAWITLALFSGKQLSFIFEVILDVKNFYMFYLYSCVSFVGVAMLLVCTPVGFTRLFSVIGKIIRRPNYLSQNVEDDLDSALLEEISTMKKKKQISFTDATKRPISLMLDDDSTNSEITLDSSCKLSSSLAQLPQQKAQPSSLHHPDFPIFSNPNGHLRRPQSLSSFSSFITSPSVIFRSHSLKSKLIKPFKKENFQPPISKYMQRRFELEQRRNKIYIWRKFVYPISMISLLAIMSITLMMVTCNIAELIITGKVFHKESNETPALGASSLSSFGLLGAVMEVIVILYLMLTSLIGIYSLPGFKRLQPVRSDTSMTIVIYNCIMILVLSSALPVLSRTLGLTNFDLLGNYGQLEWLGNTRIILIYNLIFLIVSAFCLIRRASIYLGFNIAKQPTQETVSGNG